MEKSSISVRLLESSCDKNYLDRVIKMRPRKFRNRRYEWICTPHEGRYLLLCNSEWIGYIHDGFVAILSSKSYLCPSTSYLQSLLSLFNLYTV